MLFQAPAPFADQIEAAVYYFSEIVRPVVKLHDDMNHDELFKSLLKTGRLLRDFFEAFLPKLCSFIDFGHIEFVDKERFTHKGERRTGDLLIKTRFRGEDAAFLIHLEHEGQAHRDLARRMLEYFILDWRDYGVPVYPIAVLSHLKFDPGSVRPLRRRQDRRRIPHQVDRVRFAI